MHLKKKRHWSDACKCVAFRAQGLNMNERTMHQKIKTLKCELSEAGTPAHFNEK